jgi:hypothetical protein
MEPGFSRKLTSLTARTTPPGVGKLTERFRTSSRSGAAVLSLVVVIIVD